MSPESTETELGIAAPFTPPFVEAATEAAAAASFVLSLPERRGEGATTPECGGGGFDSSCDVVDLSDDVELVRG